MKKICLLQVILVNGKLWNYKWIRHDVRPGWNIAFECLNSRYFPPKMQANVQLLKASIDQFPSESLICEADVILSMFKTHPKGDCASMKLKKSNSSSITGKMWIVDLKWEKGFWREVNK